MMIIHDYSKSTEESDDIDDEKITYEEQNTVVTLKRRQISGIKIVISCKNLSIDISRIAITYFV